MHALTVVIDDAVNSALILIQQGGFTLERGLIANAMK
jgi:hypothetical protein